MRFGRTVKRMLCSASPAHVVALMALVAAAGNLWAEVRPPVAPQESEVRCTRSSEPGSLPRLSSVADKHQVDATSLIAEHRSAGSRT